MPLPRPLSPLLALMQSGMTAPPLGGVNRQMGGAPTLPGVSSQLRGPLAPAAQGAGYQPNGKPLPPPFGPGSHQVLTDAPLGFANAPSPLESDASLGVLSDTLPSMRLEPVKPKRNILGPLLGIAGDALRGYAGQSPIFTPYMMQQRELEAEDNRFAKRLKAEQDERRARMRDPRIEQVGNTVGWLDPAAGTYNPIFTAPSPAEQYALARGFEPGTAEYQQEVETYRLGSWSDPALEAKESLEGTRYGFRDRLQDDRLATSRRNTDVRAGVTRRGQDMRSGDTQRGQNLTDKRVRESAGFQGRGGKSGGARAVAANGEPIIVRGGRWVYEKTGQPVN